MLMNAQQQTVATLTRIAATLLVHIHADAEMDTLVMGDHVMVMIMKVLPTCIFCR